MSSESLWFRAKIGKIMYNLSQKCRPKPPWFSVVDELLFFLKVSECNFL